jgi:hypothetical protein
MIILGNCNCIYYINLKVPAGAAPSAKLVSLPLRLNIRFRSLLQKDNCYISV